MRLQSLDGLRGLAACAVMAYHFGRRLAPDPLHEGLLGVDLFFIISGFVIFLSLDQAPNAAKFARGRFARLYPAYWASVVLAAVVLLPTGEVSLARVLANTTMLQSFAGIANLETAYWTLGIELLFYAAMACLSATGLLRQIEWICAGWLIGMAAWRLISPGALSAVPHLTLIHYGHLFIAGMMVYRLHRQPSARAGAVLAAALGYALFGRQDWALIPASVYAPCVAVFVLLVWDATGADRLRHILSSAPLRFLGGISYSLYLLHLTIATVIIKLAGSPAAGVAIAVPASILAAWAARRWIEVPAQRAMQHGRLSGSSPRPTPG